MTTSDAINELAAALALAQAEMHGASKDAKNPHFNSRYADLASIVDACRAPLSKHGLSYSQMPRACKVDGTWQIELETRIFHKSGQWLSDTLTLPVSKPDAQGVGSALTYARRYALAAAVGIAPEDDDGEAAVGRTAVAGRPSPTYSDRPMPSAPSPLGLLTVKAVNPKPTKNAKVTRYEVVFSDGTMAATIDGRLSKVAIDLRDSQTPVTPITKQTAYGSDLMQLRRADRSDDGPVMDDEPPLDDEVTF